MYAVRTAKNVRFCHIFSRNMPEEWCKENRKRYASQIKKLVASKVAQVNADSDVSVRVTRKNKARTGVLTARKKQGKNSPKDHGSQSYYLLCKEVGIHERKWK